MKKSLLLSLVLVFVLSLFQVGYADENEQIAKKISIDNQEVNILKDGRVAPIEKLKIKGLNKTTINKILSHMNYTDEEISKMPIEMKKEILVIGGKKINTTLKYFKSVYTDPNGVEYIITNENREQIKNQIEKDIERYKNLLSRTKEPKSKVVVSALGDSTINTDGIWSGWSSVHYVRNTGTEYEYYVYSNYEWDGIPNVYFTDTVAVAWSKGVPVWNDFAHHRYIYGSTYVYDALNTDNSSLSGTSWNFDIMGSGDRQYGYGVEKIRIPISEANLTNAISAGYAHPYSSSIIRAALSSKGITWDSTWGMKHTWRQEWTIGDQ